MKLKLVAVMLALTSATVFADSTARVDADLKTCQDQTNGVLMGVKQCMGDAITRLDKLMKPALEEAVKAVSPARKGPLRKSQQAWVKFNKANCESYIDPDAGQQATLGAYSCDYSMRVDRLKELEDIAAGN